MKLLLDGLAGNSTLQQLDLEGKSITHAGSAAIRQALGNGLSINSLLLARNQLGNEGKLKPD